MQTMGSGPSRCIFENSAETAAAAASTSETTARRDAPAAMLSSKRQSARNVRQKNPTIQGSTEIREAK